MEELLTKAMGAKLAKCRAIIISGNKFTCQLVRTLLPAIGLTDIEVCNEPGDAEHRLTTWRFDLILVDAGPAAGFDWLALLEMVRGLQDQAQARMPGILLVSQPTKELVERAMRSQIRDIIAKPLTAGGLYTHVLRALGLAKYEASPNRSFLAGHEPLVLID